MATKIASPLSFLHECHATIMPTWSLRPRSAHQQVGLTYESLQYTEYYVLVMKVFFHLSDEIIFRNEKLMLFSWGLMNDEDLSCQSKLKVNLVALPTWLVVRNIGSGRQAAHLSVLPVISPIEMLLAFLILIPATSECSKRSAPPPLHVAIGNSLALYEMVPPPSHLNTTVVAWCCTRAVEGGIQ